MERRFRPLLGLPLALCVACGGDVRPAGETVLRFVDRDPQAELEPSDLYELEPVFRFELASQEELARWTTLNLAPLEPVANGVRLTPTSSDPQLVREVDLDAGTVDVVKVELDGLHAGQPLLFWAGRWQQLTDERCEGSTAQVGDSHPGAATSYTFELLNNPSWRGRVVRLRVDPTDYQVDTPTLVAISGFRRRLAPERVQAAAQRAWKVEIGADVRNALLCPPGAHASRELDRPRGVLHLSYAVQGRAPAPVTFEVSAASASGARTVLWSRTLAKGGSGRWRDLALPLDALPQERTTITLATSSPQPFDLTRGLPLWANPEVLDPAVAPSRPNVVLVCLDTLRADHLSSYGYRRQTSPGIDAWASRSAVRFSHVVAGAPWTLPSHVSMFTGQDAARHGVNYYMAAPERLEMLAESLRAAGYATTAVTGGGYLRPQFGFAQGYDRFLYWPSEDTDRQLVDGMQATLDWLERNRGRRFFLFFHTYETHYPFKRRQPYFDRFAHDLKEAPPAVDIEMRSHQWEGLQHPGDYFVARRPDTEQWMPGLTAPEKRLLVAMYDSDVAYADAQVKHLLDELQRLGLRGRTVVVLTSDHGEALGEQDRAGHRYLEDYNLMVPLLVELPGGEGAGKVVDDQVRLVDLQPTLLDAVGLAPAVRGDGVSLLPLIRGTGPPPPEAAFSYAPGDNRGLALRVANGTKYIVNDAAWTQIKERERLVDLERDPTESRDLAATDPRVGELRALAYRTLEREHTGLRMSIVNRSPLPLVGSLGGAFAQHARVKVAAPDCGRVWWVDGGPTYQLQPGQVVTLLVDGPAAERASVAGALVDATGTRVSRFDRWFDLETLATPVTLTLRGTEWFAEQRLAEPTETAVTLSWDGPKEPAAEEERLLDSETLDQLRALGYTP